MGRAEEVGRWLDQFISNISAGAIAGVGVILLFYSAVGLLTNIESSINRIWGIQRGRPFFLRFAIYWCLITLAPPLVGFSISITTRLQSSAFATRGAELAALRPGALAAGAELGARRLHRLHPRLPAGARHQGALQAGPARRRGGRLLWSISKYVFVVDLGRHASSTARSTARSACCRC